MKGSRLPHSRQRDGCWYLSQSRSPTPKPPYLEPPVGPRGPERPLMPLCCGAVCVCVCVSVCVSVCVLVCVSVCVCLFKYIGITYVGVGKICVCVCVLCVFVWE